VTHTNNNGMDNTGPFRSVLDAFQKYTDDLVRKKITFFESRFNRVLLSQSALTEDGQNAAGIAQFKFDERKTVTATGPSWRRGDQELLKYFKDWVASGKAAEHGVHLSSPSPYSDTDMGAGGGGGSAAGVDQQVQPQLLAPPPSQVQPQLAPSPPQAAAADTHHHGDKLLLQQLKGEIERLRKESEENARQSAEKERLRKEDEAKDALRRAEQEALQKAERERLEALVLQTAEVITEKVAESNLTLARRVDQNWDKTLRLQDNVQNSVQAEVQKASSTLLQTITEKLSELNVVVAAQSQQQHPLLPPPSPRSDGQSSSSSRGEGGGVFSSSASASVPQRRKVTIIRRDPSLPGESSVGMGGVGKRRGREFIEEEEEGPTTLYGKINRKLMKIPLVGQAVKLANFIATGSTLEEEEEKREDDDEGC
jgi:hypothetical protein